MDVKEEIRKLYYARGIPQSGASEWEEGHTSLSDKSHSRKSVVPCFQILKKYYLLAVLVALGL